MVSVALYTSKIDICFSFLPLNWTVAIVVMVLLLFSLSQEMLALRWHTSTSVQISMRWHLMFIVHIFFHSADLFVRASKLFTCKNEKDRKQQSLIWPPKHETHKANPPNTQPTTNEEKNSHCMIFDLLYKCCNLLLTLILRRSFEVQRPYLDFEFRATNIISLTKCVKKKQVVGKRCSVWKYFVRTAFVFWVIFFNHIKFLDYQRNIRFGYSTSFISSFI